MCFAGEGSKIDCALAIISSGANVNIQTSDGLTALHFAAQSGACVRHAVPRCAPVRVLRLVSAFCIDASSVAVLCIDPPPTQTHPHPPPLLLPGCSDIVRALVRAGADLNVTGGRYLRTPLHVASAAGHPYVCR
jgi:hypothetical protein